MKGSSPYLSASMIRNVEGLSRLQVKHVCGAEGGAVIVVFISSFETKEAVFPKMG